MVYSMLFVYSKLLACRLVESKVSLAPQLVHSTVFFSRLPGIVRMSPK